MARALFETHNKVDALDVTWVRFTRFTDSIPTILRFVQGKPTTPDDEFDWERQGRFPKRP